MGAIVLADTQGTTQDAASSESARIQAAYAVCLASTLREKGWFNHQHKESCCRVEQESIGFVGPLCRESHATIARIQDIMDSQAETPPPDLKLPSYPWPCDGDGGVRLRFASDERPAENSRTYTSDLNAVPIWAAIVVELASGWASNDHPLSSGRVFLGPKNRFLFWPKALNDLLAKVDVAYGRLLDLFVIAAAVGSKADVKSAYRAIRLSMADALYHGAIVDGIPIVFHRLSFGMAQSPVIFVKFLESTLGRCRASLPSTSVVLSSFVDDMPTGAVTPLHQLHATERLLVALRHDGWWSATGKVYVYPATTLLYVGFLVDWPGRCVRVSAAKATKLANLIASVPIPAIQPDADVPPTAPVGSDLSLSTRIASAAATSGTYVIVARPADVPATLPPCRYIYPAFDQAIVQPHEFPSHPYTDMGQLTTAIADACAACRTSARLAGTTPTPVVIALPADLSDYVATAATRAAAAAPGAAVLIVPPPPPVVTHSLDEPAMVLPPHLRNKDFVPLPRPEDVPAYSPDTAPDTRMSNNTIGKLNAVVGLLAWLQLAVPPLAIWRAILSAAMHAEQWSPASVAALRALWTLAHYVPKVSFSVDRGTRFLVVVTDASATGWGATIHDGDRQFRFAGTLPPESVAWGSSTLREAYAAVAAVRCAFALGIAFDTVVIMTDSSPLTAADSGRVKSPAVAHALWTLAAWSLQGLRVEWRWHPRTAALAGVADAMSAAASPRPWPLMGSVLVRLWTSVGGWDVDLTAYGGHESATAVAYATPSPAATMDPERRLVLAGLQHMSDVGWRGLTEACPVRPHETAFAWPLWSDIPLLWRWWTASRARLVIVLPIPTCAAQSHWWGAATLAFATAASRAITLRTDSTVPPLPGTSRDPFPLRAYLLGDSTSHPQHVRPPPSLPPYSLAPTHGSSLGTHARTAYARGGRCPGDGPRQDFSVLFGPSSMTPLPAGSGALPVAAASIPLPYGLPPRPPSYSGHPRFGVSAPSIGPLRPPPPSVGQDMSSIFGPAAYNLGSPTPTPSTHPSLSPLPARGPPRAAPHAAWDGSHPLPGAPAPTAAAPPASSGLRRAMVAATASVMTAQRAPITTVREWLSALDAFLKGDSAGVIHPDVPPCLVASLKTARATIRLKQLSGSRRPRRIVGYIMMLAVSLPDRTVDAPCSLPVIDGLATSYALHRLDITPPFGWKRVLKAATVKSDLSSIAALSRKIGLTEMPAVCGATAADYLSARGAGSRPEHSSAYPIHLSDLLRLENSILEKHGFDSREWKAWAATIILSLFCLRPGILFHIAREMLVDFDGGYLFVWRFVSKTSSGDVLDDEQRSEVVRITAARHPALTRIIQIYDGSYKYKPSEARYGKPPRPSRRAGQPIFKGMSWDDMDGVVKGIYEDAPAGYSKRLYGVRVAADMAALEMGLDTDVTNALFWWRREKVSSQLYYGAINVGRMFWFSENRDALRFAHLGPGKYAVARSRPITAFDPNKVAVLPPQPNAAAMEAAWTHVSESLQDERTTRIGRTKVDAPFAFVALPDAPVAIPGRDPDSDSEASDTGSLDCAMCDAHVDRNTTGTWCETKPCKKGVCVRCHPLRDARGRALNVPFHCRAHPDLTGFTAQKAPRPVGSRGHIPAGGGSASHSLAPTSAATAAAPSASAPSAAAPARSRK